MNRSEFSQTERGQIYELMKRHSSIIYLEILQEPTGKPNKNKSQNIRNEQAFFRNEVKRQLKAKKRKAHTGDIVLQFDFYTTKDNPPAIHSLSKNYLDLLHKPMPHVDNLKNLLFKDDHQVKILIANYHADLFNDKNPRIVIRSYRLSSFIKDVELADKILNQNFGKINKNKLKEEQSEDTVYSLSELIREYNRLENNSAQNIELHGENHYAIYKRMLKSQIQERFLKDMRIQITHLIILFQDKFNYDIEFDRNLLFKLWEEGRKILFFSTKKYIDLGSPPSKEGENEILKRILEQQLQDFKTKFPFLFPIVYPVNLLIIYSPPKNKTNILDLDNLAIRITPFINLVLEPPTIHKLLGKPLDKENDKYQNFPKYSIQGYQVIYLERKKNDPEKGQISFIITDGRGDNSNIWKMVNDVVKKLDT